MIAGGSSVVPILWAIVGIAFLAAVLVAWVIEPWWHRNPTPRRQVDGAKDQVRLYRIRKRHPEAFAEPSNPKESQ